ARFLDERLLDTAPAAAVHAVRSELVEMGSLTEKMLGLVHAAFFENDASAIEKLNQIEEGVNDLTRRIADYSARLWRRHLSSGLSRLLEYFVNGSSDYERIGDHTKNLMELREYMTDHELAFSPQAMSEFDGMLTLVRQMVEKSTQALNGENLDLAHEVAGVLEERTDAMEKSLRHLHIQRLNEGLCAPASGVIFIDIITNLERIGDHATNVAEIILAMHGEKTGAEVPGSY
ncbi:MAG: Na/Pi cotransporter family protein, partial [Pyramidobacter sp.]|nr:Na/Pi cotransporter family protein [Pyramidobacter sp.]